MEKIYYDTSAILYGFLTEKDYSRLKKPSGTDEEKQRKRKIILEFLVSGQDILISDHMLNEAFHVLSTKYKQEMPDVSANIDYLANLSGKGTLSCDYETLLQARAIKDKTNYSWYDSVHIVIALYAGANILYAEDMHHCDRIAVKGVGEITILNPFKKRCP